jgi:hypothetical protein
MTSALEAHTNIRPLSPEPTEASSSERKLPYFNSGAESISRAPAAPNATCPGTKSPARGKRAKSFQH